MFADQVTSMSLRILRLTHLRLFYFTQVIGECDDGTTTLLSTYELMIEEHALEANISNAPQKDYCKAMPPQGRQCKLDYDNFSNNLQQRCEEAGGQHTLSYYMVTCDGASYSLQLAVNAEPGCVATVCRADDTKTLLKLHATARVIARLEGGGNFKCTLSHFRNRQPTALFDKRIAIQTNPPTTPTYAPVQTKKPSTYAPYIPPSTDVPKPEGPTVKVTSSGGICSYKLNMLLAAVVATLFFFLF